MNSTHLLDPWIGRSIGDRQRYRLDQRLGAGGMGDVFLAMDIPLGKQVAVKLLKDTLVAAEAPRKRFEREVALIAALKSDHIVEVSDCGVTPQGHPFYVMEYLRGQTLGQLLRQEQRLSVERTLGIITQVCDGLHLAHQGIPLWRDGATASEHIKVVHRDLKPDNIFLVPTALGELVKILDFGIAKIRNDYSEHTNTNLTSMFIGTVHYAAPEQLTAEKDLDARADIYNLGIILYEMLSGTDPFGLSFNLQKISTTSWMMAHMCKPLVPLRSQPGGEQLEPELEAVVMRCLQKAPDERFATADELKRALQAAVATEITLNIHHQYPFNQRILKPGKKNTVSTDTAAKCNLNPSLPTVETQEGEDKKKKKKLQRSVLIATVVAAVVSGSLAVYAYIQGQAYQSALAALESTKNSKERKNYEECVNQAKAVTQKSPLYADAQNLLNECQLEQAKDLANKNNLKDAIAEGNKIQLNSSFNQEAQQLISQWSENLLKQAEERYKQAYNSKDLENAIDITKAIPKTSAVAKDAEEASGKWQTEWNNNENYLQAAQNALNEGKPSETIGKANQVRLLGQEVKQDTPYWQTKMKPIIEKAEELIAASNSQKSVNIRQPSTRRYSTARPSTRRYSTAQPSTRRYSTAQPSNRRYSTAQPSTRRYSTQRPQSGGWKVEQE